MRSIILSLFLLLTFSCHKKSQDEQDIQKQEEYKQDQVNEHENISPPQKGDEFEFKRDILEIEKD